MDILTHAILGAAVGELVLGRRLGNRAMAWGAIIAPLPDLDVLFSPLFDHAGWLWWHCGPSHSALIITLASLLLAQPLSKLWKREKIGPALATWFIFLAWSTHVLIDCFSTYGAMALWPFVPTRISFNNLSTTDPLFTLPMLITLVWIAFLRRPAQITMRRRIHFIGLGLSCAYIGISFAAKAITSKAIERDLSQKGIEYREQFESPTLFNLVVWRTVVNCEDEILVGYRSILDGSKPVRWTVYPKGREAPLKLGDSRELTRIREFSGDWWIARPHTKGIWIGDLRFGELREWGQREGMVDHRLTLSWDLMPAEERNRLRPKPRPRVDTADMLRRLAKRAIGQREAWEGNSRLEGVTGSLPEFLLTRP